MYSTSTSPGQRVVKLERDRPTNLNSGILASSSVDCGSLGGLERIGVRVEGAGVPSNGTQSKSNSGEKDGE